MIFRDIVFALRSLRKTPLFTVVIIATLAVAIGANAAVFSVLRAVVFAPMPYAQPQDLVAVFRTYGSATRWPWSLPTAQDIRAQNRVFTDAAVVGYDTATMTGNGKPHVLRGMLTTPPVFNVLGIRPELGRFFTAGDEQPGSGLPVIISDHLWRTAFGADTNVIGKAITLEAQTYRIIGVAPPRFQFPMPNSGLISTDYWSVLRANPKSYSRGSNRFSLIARLRPGTSVAAANADIARITAALARRYPGTNTGVGGRVESFSDVFLGSVRPLLFAAFGAVIGVVVIACANVANLLLSRSAARDRELAVRFAVGATRRRIVAQLLTETLLLAIVSGVLGVALAEALIRGFIALNPPAIPRLDDISIDGIVVAYTFAIVGVCALASGLVPALALSRLQLAEALKAAGRGGNASRGAHARSAFVVLEIAISVALVVSSGLIVRSFVTLASTPLGISINDVSVAKFSGLPQARYATDTRIASFYHDSAARVRSIPGVRSVTWVLGSVPLLGDETSSGVQIEGLPRPVGQKVVVNDNLVGPEYFSTVAMPLRAGRVFTDDDRLGSAPVAIVNEAFARTYFKGKAVGHWINSDFGAGRATIVGVVANVRRTFAEGNGPNIYLPLAQIPVPHYTSLFVRVQPGVDIDNEIAAAVIASDPLLAAPSMRSLESYADADLAQTQLSAVLLGSLGIVALFLAVAGVYAVVSFGVVQRTQEFGIRMALGARGDAIVRDVLARAARLSFIGILGGVILAGIAAGLVQSELFGVGTLDPITYALVVAIVTVAALFAAFIPALRATRVDPVVALRHL